MKAKVVLVGPAHTGKTSIITRFVYGEFSPHTMASTQPAFYRKKVSYMGSDVVLEIWDTAGQEQYRSLSPMFYRDADAGIVVFDLTDANSFGKCKQWGNELRAARGQDVVVMVAGNKNDLPSIRTVALETIQAFAETIDAEPIETSAKTGENIDMMFISIAKALLKRAKVSPDLPDSVDLKGAAIKKECC
jgi:small GTP-binding protein